MLLPVTNSPRMGACGYEGELDIFMFNPDNFKKKQQDLSKDEKSKKREKQEGKTEKRSVKIPKAMLDSYDIIAPTIKEFCVEHLNEEYSDISLLMLEKLCRKRPSPIAFGKPNTWACGIIYAVGSINFLFDKSQSPHMRASELAEKFGISANTAGKKAGEIRKIMNISVFDPEWTLPSKLDDNPYVWMFETSNGFIIDIRHAPRDIQEDLFDAGMIPYIPADRESIEPDEDECGKDICSSVTEKKKREQIVVEGQITLFDE